MAANPPGEEFPIGSESLMGSDVDVGRIHPVVVLPEAIATIKMKEAGHVEGSGRNWLRAILRGAPCQLDGAEPTPT